MTTGCREQFAFWYIVLQPVVLKNVGNIAVLDLIPHMMILVEKLLLVGPNQVLAKVVYPAEGYVPREGSTCGKLIARFDPEGSQVPEELLEVKQPETYHKSAAVGNQIRCCRFNHCENLFSTGDLHLPESISRVSNDISNQFTTNECRNMCISGHPSCSSDPTKRMLRSLPPSYHCISSAHNNRKTKDTKCWYTVYQAEGSNNFSNPHSRNPINSDAKISEAVDLKAPIRCTSKFWCRNLECLLSIYHSIDRPAATVDSHTDKEEERHNTIISEKLPVAEANDDEKSQIVVHLKDRKKWRYESNRWITVSALCHELQVICHRNKRQIRSSNFEPCTIFQTNTVPEISLPDYLKRIAWFLGCPTACFVIALEYVYRLSHVCPELELNEYSVHQIVMTCIVVATKFLDDKLFKNTFYARIAGVSVTNLSACEIRLVFFLKFDLLVLPEQYVARYESMLRDNQGPDMVIIQPDGIAAEGGAK